MYTSDDTDDSVVESVVTRTAECRDVDPLDLEPLASVVDPGLVEAFGTADAVLPESELRFGYAGCEVRVDGRGDVSVRERD